MKLSKQVCVLVAGFLFSGVLFSAQAGTYYTHYTNASCQVRLTLSTNQVPVGETLGLSVVASGYIPSSGPTMTIPVDVLLDGEIVSTLSAPWSPYGTTPVPSSITNLTGEGFHTVIIQHTNDFEYYQKTVYSHTIYRSWPYSDQIYYNVYHYRTVPCSDAEDFTVLARSAQTISFPALPDKQMGDAPFALSATASSGLPVSYSSSNTNVVTVSGNTVTIRGIGDTTIVASQAGDATYFPADNISQTLHVAVMSGTVVGWGYNGQGQINIPVELTNVTAIAAWHTHSLALKDDGTIVGWGDNIWGQINISAGLTNATAIAAGNWYSLALKDDGTVIGWGQNNYGQINIPMGLTNAIAIAAGGGHSLALKDDGTVVGWGYNGQGQTSISTGLTDVTAIAAGGWHSLALKDDGTVVGWGYNNYGQISIPAGLTNVTAIAVGESYSLALKDDGTVVGWGWNYYGQTNIPAGLTNVTAIAAAGHHGLALKDDGTVVGWGYNLKGQINIPVGLTNVTAIAAGGYHSLALVPMELPSITLQPESTMVDVTFDVTFSVTAEGTAPLSYQWQKDGAAIDGAISAELMLTNVQTNQAGDYTVFISNVAGSVTSSVAVLTVNRLAQTISFGALPDKQIGDAPFTLSATASSGLPISYTNSNPDVATVSGATVTIAGIGDTTITASQAGDATYLPADNVNQPLNVTSGTYLLTVSNGTGSGDYTHQQQVVIAADEPAEGYTFDLWTGATQYVANAFAASTTVTMPSQAISVAATYKTSGSSSFPTNLVEDSFDGSSGTPPDADKFEWSGEVTQNGAGQLVLNTWSINTSWLKSKAGAAPNSGETLVLQMRAYAYAEPAVYGDLQPRGLRVGSDANNAIEFYSIYGTTLGMRVRKDGVESQASFAFPAGVNSMHDYEISVTTTSVIFKVDGEVTGTITNNIPTGVLNVYVSTYDGGFGSVPVSIDSLSLFLADSQDADGDGVPDWWEVQYFGSTGVDPSAVCSNGINTVLDAYIAGLDPTDPDALFAVEEQFRNVLHWVGVSGRVYSVYWTTNLLNGFQCLESNILWTTGVYTDVVHHAESRGFYRLDVRLEE